ncbi:MAG: endonuclease III [Candidatus Zixiibacteriota bacterium]|nr:MAG: endonuclease III [candidate division Zixibacteria bacterium]
MDALPRRLEIAVQRFEEHQGVKRWPGPSDPLDSLMLTLLSQNTNDKLRDQAYEQLRRRFASWDEVLAAPGDEVQKAIKGAGLSHQKAARMQDILVWIRERFGRLNLDSLSGMDDDAVIGLLTARKGIGIKTAAVVLMVALGRDLCPVDTHVHRLAQRLGWVPPGLSAEKTFWALRPHVPSGEGYNLHMNLLQFGRTICLARKPQCAVCFLYTECLYPDKAVRKAEMEGRI